MPPRRSRMAYYGQLSQVGFEMAAPIAVGAVIDHWRGKPLATPQLRAIAAQVVIELLDAGEGIPLKQLVRPDRPARDLWRAVQYLKQREWIDISSRKDRIWMSDEMRKKLAGL